MSRLPPALLYLTIYNPSLRYTGPALDEDEDAEEQAQILFYTAREHAVSRDKMLRQVGLAKALIHFSDMFASEDICENVHSQSRRMIMVSPEPGFWIHACIELAKSKREMPSGKGKGKEKRKDKGKGKEREGEKETTEMVYDYHDGSVNNSALRSHLLRAYGQFKLRHGSLSSILHDIGQQALELQLERFFTPWAWNWDIEQDGEFSTYLGLPLHPLHKSISPLLDDFLQQAALPDDATPFFLSSPHLVPSTSYRTTLIPAELPLHLLAHVLPPRAPTISVTSPAEPSPAGPVPAPVETLRSGTDTLTEGAKDALNATGTAFVALGSSMDVRKWSWPGYLTFGKNSTRPSKLGLPANQHDVSTVPDGVPQDTNAPEAGVPSEVAVDQESLHDAMSSADISAPTHPIDEPSAEDPPASTATHSELQDDPSLGALSVDGESVPSADIGSVTSLDETSSEEPTAGAVALPDPSHKATPTAPAEEPPDSTDTLFPISAESASLSEPKGSLEASTNASSTSPPRAPSVVLSKEPASLSSMPSNPLLRIFEEPASSHLPTFSQITVHLSPPDDPQTTVLHKVLFLVREQSAFAFLVDPHVERTEQELTRLRDLSAALLTDARALIDEDDNTKPETPIFSATKILQPKDKFVVRKGAGITITSTDFASRSEHLFNARELVSNADILEVYSRTQGPQHWHVARRESAGTVFLEVSRKEMSLTDVDNELTGVLRRLRDGES